jgi:serine/threonine protein kinase
VEGSLATNTIIGNRWRIVGYLGAGGFGEVLEAIDESEVGLGRAAVKVLHTHTSPLERSEFLREVQKIAILRHQNLVGYLDSGLHHHPNGSATARPYLVTELCDGSLTDHLARHPDGRLSTDQTITVLDHVIAGLVHLHERKLIHRDIKAANVLQAGATWKLGDFGLMRDLTATGSYHRDGAPIGTPLYMAPELFAQATTTGASDVYAIGVLAHVGATGRPLHRGSGPALLHNIAAGAIVISPDLDPVLGRFVAMTTARDPAARPSAFELAQLLHGGSPTTRRSLGPPPLSGPRSVHQPHPTTPPGPVDSPAAAAAEPHDPIARSGPATPSEPQRPDMHRSPAGSTAWPEWSGDAPNPSTGGRPVPPGAPGLPSTGWPAAPSGPVEWARSGPVAPDWTSSSGRPAAFPGRSAGEGGHHLSARSPHPTADHRLSGQSTGGRASSSSRLLVGVGVTVAALVTVAVIVPLVWMSRSENDDGAIGDDADRATSYEPPPDGPGTSITRASGDEGTGTADEGTDGGVEIGEAVEGTDGGVEIGEAVELGPGVVIGPDGGLTIGGADSSQGEVPNPISHFDPAPCADGGPPQFSTVTNHADSAVDYWMEIHHYDASGVRTEETYEVITALAPGGQALLAPFPVEEGATGCGLIELRVTFNDRAANPTDTTDLVACTLDGTLGWYDFTYTVTNPTNEAIDTDVTMALFDAAGVRLVESFSNTTYDITPGETVQEETSESFFGWESLPVAVDRCGIAAVEHSPAL